MAKTESTMNALGTILPSFILEDAVAHKKYRAEALLGERATLVMFICNHCPYVEHIVGDFKKLQNDYEKKGLSIIAINSNDYINYKDDAPQYMKKLAESEGWKFPFLIDDSQSVAKAFKAACTPDFFLYDKDQKLVYRGEWDGSRPGNSIPINGQSIRKALDLVLSGKSVFIDQKPSLGCNIKWKSGNQPNYHS